MNLNKNALLQWRRKSRFTFLRPSGVLSYQSIKYISPVSPIEERTYHENGMTYGLGPCSYDLRVAQDIEIVPGSFNLLSTIESIELPWDICATIQDKSTWARCGLVFQNTHVDPGFKGESLTLEATMHGSEIIHLTSGMPICQIKFEWLDEPTTKPYGGRYQNQGKQPQTAIKATYTAVIERKW